MLDIERHWRKLLTDDVALDIRRTVSDLRFATIAFRGVDFADLIRTIALPALAGRRWHTAIPMLLIGLGLFGMGLTGALPNFTLGTPPPAATK